MSHRWRWLATIAMGGLLSLPIGTSAEDTVEPTARQIADAADFRSSFGFPHAVALVEESYHDSRAFPDLTWGVPLSREESSELLRRLENRAGQEAAVLYAKRQPEFAGLWFDQLDGGAAHYTFTANVTEYRNAIQDWYRSAPRYMSRRLTTRCPNWKRSRIGSQQT